MKTKIDLSKLSTMTIKEFQSDVQKEFKRLAAYAQATNIVVLTDFTFKCGNIGALIIVGDLNSELQKFYKEQKTIRSKEKDFGLGTCLFLDNKIYIDLEEGAAKISDLEKGLKKTKINFDIIITKNSGLPNNKLEDKTDNIPNKAPDSKMPKSSETLEDLRIFKQLEQVKGIFQKIKTSIPNIQAGQSTHEDLQLFAILQQNIQQWFSLYTNSTADTQIKLKEQATKLKEQYSKIAALVQKNKA